MSSKITGTGAVLPYMTHLMNDAREALTSKDREIERLRNLLSMAEHCRDSAERDARECREALRPFAICWRSMTADGHTPGYDGTGSYCLPSDFERAAELVWEETKE